MGDSDLISYARAAPWSQIEFNACDTRRAREMLYTGAPNYLRVTQKNAMSRDN